MGFPAEPHYLHINKTYCWTTVFSNLTQSKFLLTMLIFVLQVKQPHFNLRAINSQGTLQIHTTTLYLI